MSDKKENNLSKVKSKPTGLSTIVKILTGLFNMSNVPLVPKIRLKKGKEGNKVGSKVQRKVSEGQSALDRAKVQGKDTNEFDSKDFDDAGNLTEDMQDEIIKKQSEQANGPKNGPG